eukprot:g49186.t1
MLKGKPKSYGSFPRSSNRCTRQLKLITFVVVCLAIFILQYLVGPTLPSYVHLSHLPFSSLRRAPKLFTIQGKECTRYSAPRESELNLLMAPQVVIATTPRDKDQSTPTQAWLQRLAMEQNSKLGPQVQFRYFTQDKSIQEDARMFGAQVGTPVKENEFGLPYFFEMVKQCAQANPAAEWVGYANADITFSRSLLDSIKAVHNARSQLSDKLLLVGIRINVHLNFTGDFPQGKAGQIIQSLAQSAVLSQYNAIDYFIFNARAWRPFDHARIAPIVIARRVYDNWLIAMVNSLPDGAVVDLSNTVCAYHLIDTTSKHTAWGHSKANDEYNVLLLQARNETEKHGNPLCARFVTSFGAEGTIVVTPRPAPLESRLWGPEVEERLSLSRCRCVQSCANADRERDWRDPWGDSLYCTFRDEPAHADDAAPFCCPT